MFLLKVAKGTYELQGWEPQPADVGASKSKFADGAGGAIATAGGSNLTKA